MTITLYTAEVYFRYLFRLVRIINVAAAVVIRAVDVRTTAPGALYYLYYWKLFVYTPCRRQYAVVFMTSSAERVSFSSPSLAAHTRIFRVNFQYGLTRFSDGLHDFCFISIPSFSSLPPTPPPPGPANRPTFDTPHAPSSNALRFNRRPPEPPPPPPPPVRGESPVPVPNGDGHRGSCHARTHTPGRPWTEDASAGWKKKKKRRRDRGVGRVCISEK